MNKNDGFVFGKYYIRLAGKIFCMESVAEAVCMKKAAHQHFGLCFFAADAGHVVGAGFLIVHICHRINVKEKLHLIMQLSASTIEQLYSFQNPE